MDLSNIVAKISPGIAKVYCLSSESRVIEGSAALGVT
jgi:hypothetical protein